MKWFMRLTGLIVISLTLLASTGVAYAQDDPAVRPRRGDGIRGKVTAVGTISLTVATRNDQTVTVHVSDDTRIRIAGSGEGSLSDIEVDNYVGIRGQKNDDDTIQARVILVLPDDPQNLGRVRGKVTAVEGSVIKVENPEGSHDIATDDETKFRVDGEEGSLADIEAGHLIGAIGIKQDDGSLLARRVVAASRDRLRRHVLRGEVLSVDTGEGSLTVQGRGEEEAVWTVQTTEETKYRVPGVDNPTLDDVPVGAQVIIFGRPDEDDSKTGTARMIAVIPEGAGRVAGEVTAITGTSFTLQTRNRGDFTILTSHTTQYRSPGDRDVSFDDIKVGLKVIVLGERVEDQEKTIEATVIGIPRTDRTNDGSSNR